MIALQNPTTEPLRAFLMRELLLDAAGRPMTEDGPSQDPDAIAAHWALSDTLDPTLMPICEGELRIISGDDGEFLRNNVITEISGSENAIRAIFTATSQAATAPREPRMNDLIVTTMAEGTSLCWEVVIGHDDMPDALTTDGELCLVLREDLGLIFHDPEGSNAPDNAALAHRAPEVTHAVN